MSIVEVNRFKVAGENERIYTIVEYQEANEAKHSGGTEMLPGRRHGKQRMAKV